MVLGKRGAKHHLHICKWGLQQLPRSHLCLEHWLSGWGCFHLSAQPWKTERLVRASHQADKDTESSQHPWAGGAKSLNRQKMKLRASPPPLPLAPRPRFPGGQEQKDPGILAAGQRKEFPQALLAGELHSCWCSDLILSLASKTTQVHHFPSAMPFRPLEAREKEEIRQLV